MHHKITGKNIKHEPHELKLVWKWLKELGHCYNITEKWRKILMEILGIGGKGNSDGDMSIDEVLQKAVMELHSK
jgi:hypothetical protein